LGGLWALEWAWHIFETNLRCAGVSGICIFNPSIVSPIVSEISAFIRTGGHARQSQKVGSRNQRLKEEQDHGSLPTARYQRDT